MSSPVFVKALVLIAFASSLAGCAATSLNPAARSVIVSRQPAPEGCQYVGSVIGEQGGSLSGGLTSNRNLALGAMNDMKNEAHALGANYVVLEDSKAGNTISGTENGISGGQTDVTNIGNAYVCPETSRTTTTGATASR